MFEDIEKAEEWFNKIGKKQTQTTADAVGFVSSFEVRSLTVHYQEYDGAKNYWDAPDGFSKYLCSYLKRNAKDILAGALEEYKRYLVNSVERQIAVEQQRVDKLNAFVKKYKT